MTLDSYVEGIEAHCRSGPTNGPQRTRPSASRPHLRPVGSGNTRPSSLCPAGTLQTGMFCWTLCKWCRCVDEPEIYIHKRHFIVCLCTDDIHWSYFERFFKVAACLYWRNKLTLIPCLSRNMLFCRSHHYPCLLPKKKQIYCFDYWHFYLYI